MNQVLKGRIIYSDGNTFKILSGENHYFAKPIGKIKLTKMKPKIGDFVDINVEEKSHDINTIIKIYERDNYLHRPIIANIDYAIIVSSLKSPNFDFYLLLKMITMLHSLNIKPLIVFSKYDLLNKEEKIIFQNIFSFFKTSKINFFISDINNKNETIESLLEKNTFNVLMGQSGAGKSTFLNSLDHSLNILTNEISIRLNRGKHTTRAFTAFKCYEKFFIVDTPGFSSF